MAWLSFPIVFLLAFGLAYGLVPWAQRLGERYEMLAVPGPRRIHRRITPRSGGIALYLAFIIALLTSLALPSSLLPPRQDPKELTRLTGLLLGSTFMFLVGLYDDRRELGPFPQLAAQGLAALIAIRYLIFIEVVNDPLTDRQVWFPWPFTVAFTIFWIAGAINTVNWLDGLDGLAAGVTAILSAILAIHMYREGQHSVVLLPLALLGATLGFLPHNFHPARIFMGSCGSFFLGFTVGTLSIIAGAKMATVLLVLGIPILDAAWQIFHRLREGRSSMEADLGHLHFRLLALGLSQRQIVGLYYVLCAFFGVLALLLPSRLYKLLALIILGGVTGVVLALVSRHSNR